jgi:hypothetical protein
VELDVVLWLALEVDAGTAEFDAAGDGAGVDAPGNDVGGAVGINVAVKAPNEEDAAAASVATADRTVVTIYVVKD